jgi:hypothetical protein
MLHFWVTRLRRPPGNKSRLMPQQRREAVGTKPRQFSGLCLVCQLWNWSDSTNHLVSALASRHVSSNSISDSTSNSAALTGPFSHMRQTS